MRAIVRREDLRALIGFWTEPTTGYSAALFRVTYGLTAIWAAIGVLLNLERYYGDGGIIPWSRVSHFAEHKYSLLALAPQNETWLLTIGVSFLVASVLLTIGFVPRLSLLVIFAIQIALQHRNPYIVNGGDRLFLILAGLGMLLPLGHQWSVDAWIRKLRGKPAPRPTTLWSQRLIGLQISYIYLFSCFAKLGHSGWRVGDALYYVMASPVFAEWPMQIELPWLIRLATWGTLAFEMLFPIFVWVRVLRPYWLVVGVVFHVGIDVTLLIPMFSTIMLVGYTGYMTDEETLCFVAWLKRPWELSLLRNLHSGK